MVHSACLILPGSKSTDNDHQGFQGTGETPTSPSKFRLRRLDHDLRPPVSCPRPRGANTGRNDGIGLRVTERVEKGSEESERPVVSSRRGNHPEGPRGEKGTPCHDTVGGKHGGCIQTLTAPWRNTSSSWPVQFLYRDDQFLTTERGAAAEERRSSISRGGFSETSPPLSVLPKVPSANGWRPARRGGPEALTSHTNRRGVGSQADPRPNASDPRFPLARCRGLWPSGASGPAAGPPVSSKRSSASHTARARCRGCSRNLGWSPQVPITRAIQRDEEAIARWRVEAGPRCRRRPAASVGGLFSWTNRGSTCCPAVVKTYSPRGERTPIVDEWQTRDHLSVMGGVTPRGQGYTLVRPSGFERAAYDRVPGPSGPPGWGSFAGGLGRIADPPAGRGLARS